jgi:hypothetical protein
LEVIPTALDAALSTWTLKCAILFFPTKSGVTRKKLTVSSTDPANSTAAMEPLPDLS